MTRRRRPPGPRRTATTSPNNNRSGAASGGPTRTSSSPPRIIGGGARPARPPQVEELHNKLKQFDEAGVMGAVYRGGACLFACGVLAFCSVAQPDRLTNAAYNLRYKETLGRILLCFAPSALLFLVVFSPKRATVGDAARAFHAAFFPAFIGCARRARCSSRQPCGIASSNV